MQAKHGFAGLFRVRGRLIVCALAVAALSAVLFAPAASAVNAPETDALGLGDSLAFGYTQEKYETSFPAEPLSQFEEGYVHFFDKKVRASSKKTGKMLQGLVEINNGCPGETTDSMIGNGFLAGAFGIPGEAPCAYHNEKGFELHHEYGGGSQLENAMGVIAAKGSKLKVITLTIGSNDELKVVKECEKQVRKEFKEKSESVYGKTKGGANATCIGSHVSETFDHILKNIGRVFFAIDHGAALGGVNYTGPIVLEGFYNPQSFVLAGSDKLQSTLNFYIESTFFSPVRCSVTHFKPPCSTEKPETEEPNPNYVPNATFANPFPKINPPKPSNEKTAICKFTEFCNEYDKHQNLVKHYEEEEEVTKEEAEAKATPEASKAYPVGDIHPTKLGYELLAKLAYSAWEANPAK